MEGGLFTERSGSKGDEKKSPRKMDFEIDICKQTDPSFLENTAGFEKEQPFRLSVKGYTRQSSYLASQAGGYEASNLSQNQSPSVYNHMQEGDEMDFLDEGAGGSYTKLSRSPELKSMGLFTESPPEKHSLFEMRPVQRESHFEGMSPPHMTFNNPREPHFMIETKDQDHGPSKYKQDKRGITSPTSSFSSRGEGSIRARNAGLHKIKEENSYQDDVSASEQYEHSHVGIASARSCLYKSAKDSTFKRGEMNKVGIENSVGSDEKSDHDPKGEMFASVNPGRAVLLSARSAVIPNQSEIEAAQWSHQKTARGEAKKTPLTSNDIPVPLSYEDPRDSSRPIKSEVLANERAELSGQDCSMKKKPYQSTIANAGPGSTTDMNSYQNHISIRGENLNESGSQLIDKVVITSMRPPLLQDPKARSGNQQLRPQIDQNAGPQQFIEAQPNQLSSLDLIKKRFLKQTNRMQEATSEIIKKGLLKVPQLQDEIIFQEGNNGEFRISRDLDTSSQPPTKNSFQYSFSSSACKQQPSPVKLGGQSSGVQIHINNNHASNIIINTTTIQDGKNQERTPNNPTSIGIDIIFVDQEQITQADTTHLGVSKPVCQEKSLERPAADQKDDTAVDKKYLLQSVSKPHKKQPVKASNSGVTPGKQPSKQQIGTVSGTHSLRRDSSNPGYKSFLAGNKTSKSTEQLGRVNFTKPYAELSEDLLPRGLKQLELQVSSQRSPKPAKSSKLGLMSTPEKTRYLPGLEEPHFSSASKQSLSTGEFIRQKTLELSINTKTGTSTEPWPLCKAKTELAQRKPQAKAINQTSKWIAPVSTNSKRTLKPNYCPKSSLLTPHEQMSTSWAQNFYHSETSHGPKVQRGNHSHLACSNEVTISSNWSNVASYSIQPQQKHKSGEKSSVDGLTSKKGSRCLMSPIFVPDQPRMSEDRQVSPQLNQPLSPQQVGVKGKSGSQVARKPTHKTVTQVASNSTLNLFRDPAIFKHQPKQF